MLHEKIQASQQDTGPPHFIHTWSFTSLLGMPKSTIPKRMTNSPSPIHSHSNLEMCQIEVGEFQASLKLFLFIKYTVAICIFMALPWRLWKNFLTVHKPGPVSQQQYWAPNGGGDGDTGLDTIASFSANAVVKHSCKQSHQQTQTFPTGVNLFKRMFLSYARFLTVLRLQLLFPIGITLFKYLILLKQLWEIGGWKQALY